MQRLCDATQHAERVPLITGRLQSADLLLGRMKELGQLFLGKSGLLTKGSNLQRYIPGLTGMLKAGGYVWVLQLLFEILVKIGFFHCGTLLCQSRMRSRAISRSRAGIA